MKRIMTLLLCSFMTAPYLQAQSGGLSDVLQQVEQNNQELAALVAYRDSRSLELKATNNLPDPQAGAYYLPFTQGVDGPYRELEISQSFEFPTVYRARKKLIGEETTLLDMSYQAKRQEILLTTTEYCLQLIHLHKQLEAEQQRSQQAQEVLAHVQARYDQDEVGILDLNKARVAYMQEQFNVQELETERQNLLLQLRRLNGDQPIDFSQTNYRLSIPQAMDSLWQEKQARDPELRQLQQQEAVASRQAQLAATKRLPDLAAGFNYQNDSEVRFSGFYAGLSVPLWSNRHKVKAASQHLEYTRAMGEAQRSNAYAAYKAQFNRLQLQAEKYREYKATLDGLQSEELLRQAYTLGEISYLDYYMEIQFYRQAYDALLDMELSLFLARAHLLKHRL